MRAPDVVVIGAGVVGLATAYEFARSGAGRVLVLEKEPLPGTGSTAACTGGIRLQFSSAAHIRMSLFGLQAIPELADRYGVDPEIRRTGYLFLVSDERRKAHFEAGHRAQAALGVDSGFVDTSWIARRAPFLNLNDVLAGSYCPEEAHADPHSVCQAYLRGLRDEGGVVQTGTRVNAIETSGARATGVSTDDGLIECGAVVICAGPHSAELARALGISMPLTPRRRHVAAVRPPFEMSPELPLIVDDASGWYVLAETGGVALLGGTDRDGTVSLEIQEEPDTLDRIFSTSIALAPELEKSGLVNTIVGLRSMSPDDRALVGRLPQVEGLYCACAFSGHGFMHAPATATGLAELITTGASETIDLSPFDPARLSDTGGSDLQPETYVF